MTRRCAIAGCLLRATLVVTFTFASLGLSLSNPRPALADTTFRITGGGWGHGIGLSQYGSRGYALQGKTYDWILAHYYQGTRLVTKPSVTIKVNLDAKANARSQWWIKSGTSTALTVIQVSDSTVRVSLDATGTYWITTSNGNTRVHKDQTYLDGTTTKHRPGAIIKSFSGACYATSGSMVRIVGASGPFGHTGVNWRGKIRFVPSSSSSSVSKAVNYVSIEQYLYGVVPRESPSSWPAEALKAVVVAIHLAPLR